MTAEPDPQALIARMAESLRQEISARGIRDPLMIGIHTGGVWVARALHAALGLSSKLGSLDISFYRDDFTRIGMNPQVKPSDLPFSVDARHIILVDDVLYTGRTVRAAMNEIFDYGRPASIMLATLVDRGGRELPIEANVVGQHLQLAEGQEVKLTGPDPLALSIQDTDQAGGRA